MQFSFFTSYSVCFSFHMCFSISRQFNVSLCEFLLFLICHFSRHITGPTVCNFHFSRFSGYIPCHTLLCLIFHNFQFYRQNPGTTVCISHYFTYSTVSSLILGPIVCVSQFAHFPVFFHIFHVLQYEFLIFLAFHFSCHITSPTM